MSAPASSQILRCLLDVRQVLQSLRVADGFAWDVKDGSVVMEPKMAFETLPTSDLPFFSVAGLEFTGDRVYHRDNLVMDTVTFIVSGRMDVGATSTFIEKFTLWSQLIAMIEQALVGPLPVTPAYFPTGRTSAVNICRNSTAIDTKLNTIKGPLFGDPSNRIVLVEQAVTVKLQPRLYGAPV